MCRRQSTLDLLFSLTGGALLLFLVAPLATALFSSTPASLWETLHDPQVLASIQLTFLSAAAAVACGMLMGVPLSYLLARRRFRGKRLIEAMINLPIVIPHTAAGVALLLVFGRRGTLVGLLAPLGIIFTDRVPGIIVAMAFVGLPFLVTTARDAFALVDEEYELAALADGASNWQAFRLVAVPLAWQGVLGGALMMWARGVSEFGAVVILAYHPKVVPVLVYERFEGFGLPAALPLAVILIACALVAFAALNALLLPRRR